MHREQAWSAVLDEADSLWATLTERQRLAQPQAVYRTTYATDRNGSIQAVGCVGLLRQPVGATPRR